MTMAMKIKEREEVAVLAHDISSIKKKRGTIPDEMIINFLDYEQEQFDEIVKLIDSSPDKDEWELAEMILYK